MVAEGEEDSLDRCQAAEIPLLNLGDLLLRYADLPGKLSLREVAPSAVFQNQDDDFRLLFFQFIKFPEGGILEFLPEMSFNRSDSGFHFSFI